MLKENILQPEQKEKELKKVIVEIGPNDRPLPLNLMTRKKDGRHYYAGGEELFNLKSGDMFFEVDLPEYNNIDVSRHRYFPGDVSNLTFVKRNLEKGLPEGVKSEVLYADGQQLPFSDDQVDVLFMANVISGHVKDDKIRRSEASGRRIFREKTNLIKEAKRVLKIGGKLIIQEEYAPALSVKTAYEKILHDLKDDPDFSYRRIDDEEEGSSVLELTKRSPIKDREY